MPLFLALMQTASVCDGQPQTTVERLLGDFAGRDLAAIQTYLADDAVIEIPYSEGWALVLTGSAAASAYFTQVFATYSAIRFVDPVITPAADCRTVFVESRAEYTTASGESHTVGYVWAVETEAGRLSRSRTYILPVVSAPPP